MTIHTATKGRDAIEAIARAFQQNEDFTTSGALKGIAAPPSAYIDSGRMHDSDARDLYKVREMFGIDYVVFSYGTPIAYRTAQYGKWVVPDAKYSVTTSKHQTTIRQAIEGGNS